MVRGKSPKIDTTETSSSVEIESLNDFQRVNESIKEISNMIDNLKPKGTFETQVKLVLHALSKHVQVLSTNCSAMSTSVDTVESNLAKTDQYSRRSTVLVTGMDYKKESETYESLSENVASELSKSGVKVDNNDFAAWHRNGNKAKTVKRNGREVVTPPSITVQFINANKKDRVLKGYKNFEGGKPKKVKVVQSLNNYYQELKYNISNLCRENGNKVLWIHWRSPSSGLCIKLEDDRYFARIHSMKDFTNRYFSE